MDVHKPTMAKSSEESLSNSGQKAAGATDDSIDPIAVEQRVNEIRAQYEGKITELATEIRILKNHDVILQEREKLRDRLREIERKHKLEMEAKVEANQQYEETKRLVEKQDELTKVRGELDQLKSKYRQIEEDVNEARRELLSELLDDIRDAANSQVEDVAAAAKQWAANPKAMIGKEHIQDVSKNHNKMLKEAERESSMARKARNAIECGSSSNKVSLDPKKYQFVKIMELVRLRLEKKDREAQRAIVEVKTQMQHTGGGRLPTGASMSTGLMSASKARLPTSDEPREAEAEGMNFADAGDAAGMVAKLEQELESMKHKNARLEARCEHVEGELKVALGHADDVHVLKSKAMQLLERLKGEKEARLRAESATKLANKKVLALSQHIEKLMLHLKHEAAAKAKAHETAGRGAQEVSLLRARNAALGKRAAARDRVIMELKEGAKILEDQLRLMDEKYMELRTKLDYTRQASQREVTKYKQQASNLRAKWALLSNSPGHQPTLLDEMEVPSEYMSQSGWAGPETGDSPGRGMSTERLASTAGRSRKGKKSRPTTQQPKAVQINVMQQDGLRPASSMPALM